MIMRWRSSVIIQYVKYVIVTVIQFIYREFDHAENMFSSTVMHEIRTNNNFNAHYVYNIYII